MSSSKTRSSTTTKQSTTAASTGAYASGVNVASSLFFAVEHVAVVYALWNLYHNGGLYRYTSYLLVALYVLTAFSLSAGYHRLYSHGSFAAVGLFKAVVLFFGAGAFLGSITRWCRYHRAHHRFLNKPMDPMNIKRGFLYAHIGWICTNQPDASLEKEVDVSDVKNDMWASLQSKTYFLLAILSGFVLPTVIAAQWGDAKGGFLYAGLLRVVLVQHAFFSTTSFAHLYGTQKYSDETSARNNFLVAVFTLGEGYQNFNHNFPKDYRMGVKFYDFDPTKFVIRMLSLVGITYDLKSTKMVDVKKAHLLFKQAVLDRKKKGLDFGPEENHLPIEAWESIDKRVKQGEKLVVVDGIVHDVGGFIKIHPGGFRILDKRVGKDATIAFNGGLYRHSKAARNILATLRVSRLPSNEISARTQSDYFKADDE